MLPNIATGEFFPACAELACDAFDYAHSILDRFRDPKFLCLMFVSLRLGSLLLDAPRPVPVSLIAAKATSVNGGLAITNLFITSN
jgi:hypothetical protein